MPPTKLQRWLDLIAFLAARRFPVTVEQVMEGVPTYAAAYVDGDDRSRSSARRTFERDKVELREAGIPIETVKYRINYGHEEAEGYLLARRDFHLPYVKLLRNHERRDEATTSAAGSTQQGPAGNDFILRQDELRAALEGLEHVRHLPSSPFAADAAAAFRKLTFDLPTGFPSPSTSLYLDPPGVPDSRETLRALSDALLRRKSVSFRYHGIRRGEATDRRVDPYGLTFRMSRWYLVGRDESRGAVRVFRVSRMHELVVNAKRPRTPDYEVPPDFDLSTFASREAWQLARGDEAPLKARVLFRFPRSLWAERNGHGTLVEQREDGSAVREFELVEPAPFLRWLLPQGDDVVLELPAELREELRRMGARVADTHGLNRP